MFGSVHDLTFGNIRSGSEAVGSALLNLSVGSLLAVVVLVLVSLLITTVTLVVLVSIVVAIVHIE